MRRIVIKSRTIRPEIGQVKESIDSQYHANFLYCAMVLRCLKDFMPRNYCGGLMAIECPSQMVQDVPAVVQWTNAWEDIKECPFHRNENPFAG